MVKWTDAVQTVKYFYFNCKHNHPLNYMGYSQMKSVVYWLFFSFQAVYLWFSHSQSVSPSKIFLWNKNIIQWMIQKNGFLKSYLKLMVQMSFMEPNLRPSPTANRCPFSDLTSSSLTRGMTAKERHSVHQTSRPKTHICLTCKNYQVSATKSAGNDFISCIFFLLNTNWRKYSWIYVQILLVPNRDVMIHWDLNKNGNIIPTHLFYWCLMIHWKQRV